MHYLDEDHVLLFLVQVLLLLALAKILGGLCQRRGIPAVAGELTAGILLGPSILGRTLPGLYAHIFPPDPLQATMLETVAWFGVLFLLLATGFEVSIATVWKQGKASVIIGVVGVMLPFLMGCAVFWWFPDTYHGPNSNRVTFTLFLATAAAISAIPVIAKILHDLDALKSDFGLTTLSAFIVNDVLGWLIFTLVLGLALPAEGGPHEVARVFFEALLFGTVCLTVGSKVVGAITARLQASSLPQPGTTLTFICCLGLFCGAITQWIGIHAILGFFLAGIMAGNAEEVKENTREIISQMIYAIFVPVFFASIGVKVDFLHNLDVVLIVVVTSVAVGGKYVGAWAGGRLAGMSTYDSVSLGIAHIPGGAMEIVLGMLALELELIPENVFVAVVFAAVSSSVAVGPLLAWSIHRQEHIDMRRYLLRRAVCLDLEGRTRHEVIPELCAKAAYAVDALDAETLTRAVAERETLMGTGLEKGVAVPHARLAQIETPVVAFGRSRAGIDWDARDGLPCHFVFLILTPEKEEGLQVQIMAAIARVMSDDDVASRIMTAANEEDAYNALSEALSKAHRPQMATQTA